ncbi:MAG: hypothetical protein FIA99_19140 [Ruminiclostridium sp.]|nr:hypothetical protein [Ruminiclostridium sp.]
MGSGGYNRRKGNINQYRHINIRFLQQKNCLKQPCSFIYSWGDREIVCSFDGYSLNINYAMNKGNYIIGIAKTRTNYGYREWFICPLCSRRTTALYYRWNYYGCRICQSLNYSSSQQSHNRMEQVNRKIYKIQDRLEAEHDPLIYYSIPKPKRMHYRTYEKLLDRLAELDEQSGNAFVSECEKRLGIKL